MAIMWAKNVIIDNEPSTIEIFLGERFIGDRTYYKITGAEPVWFRVENTPVSQITRNNLIEYALKKMKNELAGREIKQLDGSNFDWKE